MNEYSSGPGLFDPHIISDMKVTDVFKGEFFTSQKLEDKPNVFLSITSNFDIIFTQEEKKEVIIDISKLNEMKHPSITKQVPYNGLSSCYVMYNVANNNEFY
ncbi:hypothetical protein M9Y10_024663 [Tritrichomonas musculus]|uniref:Uncharacterized protein n=1 Tax=Tritrichomonas musculus TaxID=1915356 RepID=A0ABR2HBS3_9EUKA